MGGLVWPARHNGYVFLPMRAGRRVSSVGDADDTQR